MPENNHSNTETAPPHAQLVQMNPGGRLLIIEMVLPAGDTPHPGKMLDMVRTLTPFNCITQLKVLALYKLKGKFPR